MRFTLIAFLVNESMPNFEMLTSCETYMCVEIERETGSLFIKVFGGLYILLVYVFLCFAL